MAMLVLGGLGGVAPFVAMNILAPTWGSSGWAFTLSIVMSVVLAICGLLAPIAVVEALTKHKTFNAHTVKLHIGPTGLMVPGLANVPWSEVLATEGIPDSSTSIVIQTASHLKWLVQTTLPSDLENSLLPVLRHYMDLCAKTSETLVARVKPFKRPVFYCLIILGYVLGVIIAVLILILNNNRGFISQLVVAIDSNSGDVGWVFNSPKPLVITVPVEWVRIADPT
ncbi:hypothetical protein [Pseudomonas sp. B329]|uniref:hypothetical protein n=1 Tax=Pseudomonas sp. B329 TaxID=1553459 RepID=UPI002003CEDC|nr:hypothetical protein [Pseudomonas sp. B329]